jgi:site-specific DNA-methyltransferase (adenine-specific)
MADISNIIEQVKGIDTGFTGTRIIHGDALQILPLFPTGIFGGVICDPPYASGASTQNAKQRPTSEKYTRTKPENALPDFEGDSKDQRSWTNWMTEWLYEARRISKPGAPICMFIDWRQLPSMTDALQWAGWIWRGTLVWDKTNCRPQRGRFRQQAEFIVWGSNGHMPANREAPILPGVFRQSMPSISKRTHQTEKPLNVMREIVHIAEPGSILLDPFVGSGTTVLAAKLEGHPAVGIELSEYYAIAAQKRLDDSTGEDADNDQEAADDSDEVATGSTDDCTARTADKVPAIRTDEVVKEGYYGAPPG